MRKLRPPSPIAVAPIVITDVNSEAAAGLKPWRFRQLVIGQNLPHKRLGQLLAVEASVLLEALRADPTENGNSPVTESEDEADRVLRALGRRRAG